MKISIEEALEIVEKVTHQGGLSKVQEIVFRQCWEGSSYQEIARNSGYQLGYIRDVGHKLWQSLSKAFGQRITKTNFQRIINQYQLAASCPTDKCQASPASAFSLPTLQQSTVKYKQEWKEIIDVSKFFGRTIELANLEEWIVSDRCRVVSLSGMPGIGKTSLAAVCAEKIQHEFEYLIWHNVRNAQPIKELLAEIIIFLGQQPGIELPQTIDGLLACLMKYLRQHRCLLILDNYESVLQSGGKAGRYRDNYEGYGQLLRQVADERHQSCLLLTTRELPISLNVKAGDNLPVRSLQLSGLSPEPACEILAAKGLIFTNKEARELVERYSGNPLALKIAAASIQSLYKKNVSKFLSQDRIVFGEIWDLLEQQFNRLSNREKQVMLWLTNQDPHLLHINENDLPGLSIRNVLEALQSLQQRSLIKNDSFCFTQPNMILEYIKEVTHYKSESSILKFTSVPSELSQVPTLSKKQG
ncbi:NB-ARC domain protein [Gloeocapsa sp. PCC 7428]|uniref:NB-ARC domain-containing protein n=1 Tax=Gloeocapsa sp. PCC 7428 TaxID=1173026 RepID=UPI0002A5DCBB|nr:NB-ARC domain-containing protein [Gloeocapsa sp. PCC 7428]AFZ32150.1 NB-ARC domain protein [Gloeocapsa sp. PCC 7428]